MSKRPKPSPAQRSALGSILLWGSNGGIYMPFASVARTYEACERHGWIEYVSVDDGHRRNGYRLTAAGQEILAASPAPSHGGKEDE